MSSTFSAVEMSYTLTQFFSAVENGDLVTVSSLVKRKSVDVNAKRNFDETALHIASANGYLHIVKFLMSNGADLHQSKSLRSTPLELAIWCYRTDVVELLIFSGARMDRKTDTEYTLLHYAARNNRPEIAKILIVFGFDAEKKTFQNQSPLDVAEGFQMITLLLDLGAEVTDNTIYNASTVYKEIFYEKTKEEREAIKRVTMRNIQREVGIRLMRYVQDDIIGICLAMFPLDLPAYVLLWIIDWLPNYDKLNHLKKIGLIQSVYNSIRKLKDISCL